MEEVFVKKSSLPEAYHEALERLYEQGRESPVPDWNTSQKEIALTMVVTEPLAEPMISRLSFCDPRSLEQYRQEMLCGILDFEIERGRWAYTYHARYADQYDRLINELRRNTYSRRACMVIRRPDDIDSEDPPCLSFIQYFIREGKLDCFVLFRSNDACKAAFMNAFALIMLQKQIADELGVEMGTYTHRADSFHCYARDYGMLEGYISRLRADADECVYDYAGEWDELMEEAREEIDEVVSKLRREAGLD